jgi:hypothetical protein
MSTQGERVQAERAQRTTARPSKEAATPAASLITRLQRTIGNRAVQRLVENDNEDLSAQIRSASGGQPLEDNVQRELEAGLGSDLSGVRVHTDAHADALTRDVNATAFTSGSHIFFRAGAYDPGSASGRHTLAHEAVHTIQQASGPVAGTPVDGGVSLSSPDDSYERAAEATATDLTSSA